MNTINTLQDLPQVSLSTGERLLEQGGGATAIYFLRQGRVRIIKDGVTIAEVEEPGASFGEMAIFLDLNNSATVECLEESTFYHVADPQKYLKTNPDLLWHITRLQSQRLHKLNQYMIDIKKQFGSDPLGLIDDVMNLLLYSQDTGLTQKH